MQKLISELKRLYLPPGAAGMADLGPHLLGDATITVNPVTEQGLVRAAVMDFDQMRGRSEDAHWSALCDVAGALQSQLGLPAPAVSISGGQGYRLWLSFATPLPVAEARQFLALLRQAYCPDVTVGLDGAFQPMELPPCLHQASGKWAAFIHPGMGAAFVEEPGLDMPPPFAAQSAFLEGLRSISEQEFAQAMQTLRQGQQAAPPAGGDKPAKVSDRCADSCADGYADGLAEGLLLKDATLEDIIRHLHAKNIEPTFRHLMPGSIR